jgi:hypothetical protein
MEIQATGEIDNERKAPRHVRQRES